MNCVERKTIAREAVMKELTIMRKVALTMYKHSVENYLREKQNVVFEWGIGFERGNGRAWSSALKMFRRARRTWEAAK